jgi:hypothetical protein
MALRTDHRVIRELTAGAVAGMVGTAVMSTLMLTAQRAGMLGEQPPRKVSDAVLDAVGGGSTDERTRRLGTAFIHLGIGAMAAALHQVGRQAVGHPRPAPVWGSAVGAMFWAVNYGLIAPKLGILPPPDRDRRWRAPVMLAANVVWGAVSTIVGDRLVQHDDQAPCLRRTAVAGAYRGSSRSVDRSASAETTAPTIEGP